MFKIFKKITSLFLISILMFSFSMKPKKIEAAQVAMGAEFGGVVAGPPGAVVGAIVGGAVAVGGLFLAAEHTKGKRPSTHDKHTKPRPGRDNTKNRGKTGWQDRSNKRPK